MRSFSFSDDFTGIQTGFRTRVERTRANFPSLVKVCSEVIAFQWKIRNLFSMRVKEPGSGESPPHQQFIMIYFARNAIYLRAAFTLAQEGSTSPCYDVLRTVFETILRGYLFALAPDEAKLMYGYIKNALTSEQQKDLKRKAFFNFDYNLKRLWDDKDIDKINQVYRQLCRFSHPSVLGAELDWRYSKNSVKDCLRMTSSLSFGNIQVLMEGFPEYIKGEARDICRDALVMVRNKLGFSPLFTPSSSEFQPRMEIQPSDIIFDGKSLLKKRSQTFSNASRAAKIR